MQRCSWAKNELAVKYHDTDWGVPLHDDRGLFEFLILEGAQAGLSWDTILRKREAYRKAFDNFDPAKVARYSEAKCAKLLLNEGIIRNRLKIASAISNAKAFLKVQKEFGSFDAYVWSFVGGKPINGRRKGFGDVPAKTEVSDALSKNLRKRGFNFVGSTIMYAFMQATGMVNDHVTTCFRYKQIGRPKLMKKLLFSVVVVLLTAGALAAQVTAIRAGRIVDPETGRVSANQIILIEGPDIKAVGADVSIPAGTTIIDLSKFTVMPGMMDAHTHLCMNMQHRRDAGRYYYTTLNDSNAKRAIQGAVNARSMLEYGFTAVRDVGNEGNYACTEVRRAINDGTIDGPLVINAGRIIAPYGGQFGLQPDKQNLAEPEYFFADTRDEIRKAIRQNLHYGATVIKLVVDDQRYIYSVDDIKFAIEEAHLAGVKLAAHAWTAAGALNAAKAGVDSIEHAVAITDEALAIAKQNNVAVVPIPFTEADAALGGEPGGNKAINQRWFIDPVQRAHKAGVTLVWGPDVIFNTNDLPRGKLSIDGVDEWKQTGIPSLVILQALTTNAAKLLGIEKTRGWIKHGFRADIIAVRDNPLEKIETVKDVVFVMRSGKVYKRASEIK